MAIGVVPDIKGVDRYKRREGEEAENEDALLRGEHPNVPVAVLHDGTELSGGE